LRCRFLDILQPAALDDDFSAGDRYVDTFILSFFVNGRSIGGSFHRLLCRVILGYARFSRFFDSLRQRQ
jgi:hypothetical protein